MMGFLKKVIKFLPLFLMALVLAIVVWVSSVTSSDPNEVVTYSTSVPITVLGQNPDLLIMKQSNTSLTVTLRAPRSVHEQIARNFRLITAQINLSGLDAGDYSLTPVVNTDSFKPVQVVEMHPDRIDISLEQVEQKSLEITINTSGSLPISYEASEPVLSTNEVQIVGPQSLVRQVASVVGNIDLTNATSSINRNISLREIDKRGTPIEGVSLSPSSVTTDVEIKQLVGYRNVFIKVVTTGTIAQGYHLTGLVVTPPNVTIYASDPDLAANMPAFLDTEPINLTGAYENFSLNVALQLQDGIVVVGNPEVTVNIGIEAIQSSIQLLAVPVEIINMTNGLKVNLSPDTVDLYISGPMNLLEQLVAGDIKVVIDLKDRIPGTYQLTPEINLIDSDLHLDSILPGTIEVVLWR
jgi:YbbR domain-containing protein